MVKRQCYTMVAADGAAFTELDSREPLLESLTRESGPHESNRMVDSAGRPSSAPLVFGIDVCQLDESKSPTQPSGGVGAPLKTQHGEVSAPGTALSGCMLSALRADAKAPGVQGRLTVANATGAQPGETLRALNQRTLRAPNRGGGGPAGTEKPTWFGMARCPSCAGSGHVRSSLRRAARPLYIPGYPITFFYTRLSYHILF
jgi:hypothetical protein